MSKLFVSEHPLIHTKMAMLRDEQTGTKEFREIIGEVASLLLYEATRDLPLKEDPMLATGGSADAAIGFLKARGVKNIIFLCILAATEGVERLQKNHPDVDIYAAAYDDGSLNEHGYIVPGLGDAGDRIFGTK